MNPKSIFYRLAAVSMLTAVLLLGMYYLDRQTASASSAGPAAPASDNESAGRSHQPAEQQPGVSSLLGDNTPTYLPVTYVCRAQKIPLANSGFEAGHVAWIEYTDGDSPWIIIRDDAAEMGVIPHGGYWVAWIKAGWAVSGGTASYIQQTFTIPPCRPVLTLWYWSLAEDTWCPPVCFDATISIDGVGVAGIPMEGNSTEWTQARVDLSEYIGRTVIVRLTVPSNQYSHPDLVVDDFQLEAVP